MKRTIKKILFAIDNSSHARAGIQLAARLSKSEGAAVHILHVVPPLPYIRLDKGGEMVKLGRELRMAGEELVMQFQNALEAEGAKCFAEIADGDIVQSIIDTCEREECGLIIMGARGQSDIKSLLLGSISHKVLQLSNVPVLIAK